MKKTSILFGLLLAGVCHGEPSTAIKELPLGAPAKEEKGAKGGPFDKLLDGNLVKLDGKKVGKVAKDFAKPEKYYVFYYSASWCQPAPT